MTNSSGLCGLLSPSLYSGLPSGLACWNLLSTTWVTPPPLESSVTARLKESSPPRRTNLRGTLFLGLFCGGASFFLGGSSALGGGFSTTSGAAGGGACLGGGGQINMLI